MHSVTQGLATQHGTCGTLPSAQMSKKDGKPAFLAALAGEIADIVARPEAAATDAGTAGVEGVVVEGCCLPAANSEADGKLLPVPASEALPVAVPVHHAEGDGKISGAGFTRLASEPAQSRLEEKHGTGRMSGSTVIARRKVLPGEEPLAPVQQGDRAGKRTEVPSKGQGFGLSLSLSPANTSAEATDPSALDQLTARGNAIHVLQEIALRHRQAVQEGQQSVSAATDIAGQGEEGDKTPDGETGRLNASKQLLANAAREVSLRSAPQGVDANQIEANPAPGQPNTNLTQGSTTPCPAQKQEMLWPGLEKLVDRLIDGQLINREARNLVALPHPDFGKVTVGFSLEGANRLGVDLSDAPRELRIAVSQALAAGSLPDAALARQDRHDGQQQSAEARAQAHASASSGNAREQGASRNPENRAARDDEYRRLQADRSGEASQLDARGSGPVNGIYA